MKFLMAVVLACTILTGAARADMFPDASNAVLPVARTNLGLGTMATQNADAVAITNGSLNGPIRLSISTNSIFGNRTDWVDTYAYGCGAAAAICSQSPGGAVGVTGASRNTDNAGGNAVSAGLFGWNFNFNTATPAGGWGIYTESRHIAGAGPSTTIEVEITQLGPDTVDINPYIFSPTGMTGGVWIGSGGGCGTGALPTCYTPGGGLVSYPASTAIGILSNGSKFRTGISVDSGAFDPAATTLSTNGRFAFLAKGQGVEWASSSSTTIGSLSADTTTAGAGSLLWTASTPLISLVGKESGGKTYSIVESGGQIYFQDRTDNAAQYTFGDESTAYVSISSAALYSGVGIHATLPTSAGAGGVNVCIDSAGVFYKKATCP